MKTSFSVLLALVVTVQCAFGDMPSLTSLGDTVLTSAQETKASSKLGFIHGPSAAGLDDNEPAANDNRYPTKDTTASGSQSRGADTDEAFIAADQDSIPHLVFPSSVDKGERAGDKLTEASKASTTPVKHLRSFFSQPKKSDEGKSLSSAILIMVLCVFKFILTASVLCSCC